MVRFEVDISSNTDRIEAFEHSLHSPRHWLRADLRISEKVETVIMLWVKMHEESLSIHEFHDQTADNFRCT